jgi:hypothetical protein
LKATCPKKILANSNVVCWPLNPLRVFLQAVARKSSRSSSYFARRRNNANGNRLIQSGSRFNNFLQRDPTPVDRAT